MNEDWSPYYYVSSNVTTADWSVKPYSAVANPHSAFKFNGPGAFIPDMFPVSWGRCPHCGMETTIFSWEYLTENGKYTWQGCTNCFHKFINAQALMHLKVFKLLTKLSELGDRLGQYRQELESLLEEFRLNEMEKIVGLN